MATKRPAAGPAETPESGSLDFRDTADDAWWMVSLRLEGQAEAVLRVMYSGFSEAEDERFEAAQFRNLAEVEDFRGRFRPTAIQLQDSECEKVIEGMEVCVSYAFGESDVRFYDAIVEEVNYSEHVYVKGEDMCSCTFVVLWQHGPMAGEKTSTTIENICVFQYGGLEMEPMLDRFLGMARRKFERGNSQFSATFYCSLELSMYGHELARRDLDSSNNGVRSSRHDLDSSNNGVTSSSGNASLMIDGCSKKPKFSPSNIEITKAYDPVWTYCHAFMQPNNQVECSFCGRTYTCSMKVKCHLAGIGGHIESCPSVPVYWRVFYSRYMPTAKNASNHKPQEMIVAEIQRELDAEVVAGCIPLPPDRDPVTIGMRRTSSSTAPSVLYHVEEEEEEEMVGVGYKSLQGSMKMTVTDKRTERRQWERKVRMRLQRCLQCFGIPHLFVQNPDFKLACRHIAAAAKAGHDDILPTPQEMSVWVHSDSEDEK